MGSTLPRADGGYRVSGRVRGGVPPVRNFIWQWARAIKRAMTNLQHPFRRVLHREQPGASAVKAGDRANRTRVQEIPAKIFFMRHLVLPYLGPVLARGSGFFISARGWLLR